MSAIPEVSLKAVAALFLERQHLKRPRARSLSPRRLVQFVEAVGGLQLDSINVIERAHYLTLFSRFGPYDRERLDRLVYRRRLLFDYWAHAACLVSRGDLAGWRRAMLDYSVTSRGWVTWLQKNEPILRQVEAELRAGGPLGSADFGEGKSGGAAGWWNWKPTTHALDYLWMTGTTLVHSRRHFHKRYHLAERVLPEIATVSPPDSEEFQRWRIRRSLLAMGAATETDLRLYLTFPRTPATVRRRALDSMRKSGEVVELRVRSAATRAAGATRWYALAADLPALARAGRRGVASTGTTLLSPFDSFLWHRDRTRKLFGFDYTLEVYTPGHKRVHGYYSLPILHDGQLVGRVDAKNHRATRLLELVHVHLEPWAVTHGEPPAAGWGNVTAAAVISGLGEAVGALATFTGAERIRVKRVTPAKRSREVKQASERGAVSRGA
ncbi:MAG: winged helix-turn-helix domain-containing protein [Candidatus Eisenbacteria bacterium]|uniref:Winged helix-turn-helix domain-containing protein n=1 Tax=Eiseniibacteriota bacterium TaxID=2212470 RepID=A0A849SPI1_UNCEI|nr:winged helix-turn-helix domain-containing protein [Candidatus Eisenbacteria bacterium]